MSRALLVHGALALALLGCKKPEVSDAVVMEKAQAAIEPFKAQLEAELGKGLAESPEKAIEVCSQRAAELARQASKPGVVVGRTAPRLRNAANAPKDWLVPVMDELAKPGAAPKVVRLPDGRHGYAKAIRIQAPCLTCHGKTLAPNVTAALDARYPGDRARGYDIGDFRGVFWAEVD